MEPSLTDMGSKLSLLIFQPPEVTYVNAKKNLIWLPVPYVNDNPSQQARSIPAFFIDRKAKITILFSHGNAEDIGLIYEWYKLSYKL